MNKIYGLDAIRNIYKISGYIRKNRIKILQTFHPNADLYGPIVGRISHVPIVISSRRDLGLNRPNHAVQKRMNHLVHKMIAPSHAVKKATMDQENVPATKIKVIYNGIDAEYFKPGNEKWVCRKQIEIQKSHFVVTIVANYHKIKGIDYFIKAASLIAREIPNSKFVIIGDGKEKDNLMRLAIDLGILQKMISTGNISNVKNYLAASDIYISSSLTEGFSNSILEAMAMGLPVIATDVGGNREAVADGKCGFLVPPQDFQKIASKTIQLHRNPDMRMKMGIKSREIVEERFTLERMVKEHEELYTSLEQQYTG
jgi:glycosyltransferase involved in cell wall biosynthesis